MSSTCQPSDPMSSDVQPTPQHSFEKLSDNAILVDSFKFQIRRKNKNDIKWRCITKKTRFAVTLCIT